MNPIRFQVVDQEYDGAAGPGEGICPGYGSQLIDKTHGNCDIGHTQQTPGAQHDDHGNHRLSCAAHNARNAMGKCQHAVEQAHGTGMLRAESHDFGRTVENCNQLWCKEVGENADDFCRNTAAYNSKSRTFFNTVILFCT